MNTIRTFLVCALIATAVAAGGRAMAVESPRALSGELVVINPTAHRFRLVGHDGSFVAPADLPIETLDGRNVEIEVAANGHVTQVTEVPVHIDPITHGWSTVRGEMVVTNAAARTFTVAGDDQTYVAPADFDVAPYAGKMVEIRIGDDGRVHDIRLTRPVQ